jgi:hypothetical protein
MTQRTQVSALVEAPAFGGSASLGAWLHDAGGVEPVCQSPPGNRFCTRAARR